MPDKPLTPEQKRKVRELMVDEGNSRAEAVAWVRAFEPPPVLSLARTKAALAVWDAEQPGIYRQMSEAMTGEAVYTALAAFEAADLKVKEAFAEDTADVNPRDRAMLINVGPWLREMVSKYGG